MNTIREFLGGGLAIIATLAFLFFIFKWIRDKKKGIKSPISPLIISFALIIVAGIILPESESQQISNIDSNKENKIDSNNKIEKESTTLTVENKQAKPTKQQPEHKPNPQTKINTISEDMKVLGNALTSPASKASEGMSAIGDLFTQAGNNPMIMYNDDWIIQTAMSVMLLEEAGKDFKQINIKSEHQEVVNTLNDVHLLGDNLIQIKEKIISGIDNDDAKQIEQAAVLIQQVNKDTEAITQTIISHK